MTKLVEKNMSSEPQSNLDPEQSPPVEEMIPLVKPEGNANAGASDGSQPIKEGEDSSEEPRELTPEEMDQYECRSCGYTYEPTKGDNRSNIESGIQFKTLPVDWRCPVCGASRTQFSNIGPAGTASGFKENLSYGFGVNTLTPGQKNVLIFGALGLGVLFFLSLYGLQ